MRIYPHIYEHIVYPVYHYFKGDKQWSAVKEARRLQWSTPEELAAIQRSKLDQLLQHAYAHVPYYRTRFQRMGIEPKNILDRFENLPPLEKKDIRQNLVALKDDTITADNGLISNSTGGSTGEKLIFFHDQKSDARRMATTICEHEALGVSMGERQAHLWGAAMDVDLARTLRGKLHGLITNQIILSTYDLSPESLQRYYERLKHFRPRLLTSYPSPLAHLCQYMRSHGLKLRGLSGVITSAETLFPWQRELIEETLDCPVYNRYGSREFGNIAHEYPCGSGLHVHSERVLLEILDDDLKPVSSGQSGEIYVTDLDNYGMPFIRYRIGDTGRWGQERYCVCGRGGAVLEAIEGRSFDIVRAPNGNALGGTFWSILFRERPGIYQFQVYQPDTGHIIIRYRPESEREGLPKDSQLFWCEKIKDVCGEDLSIDFHCVDEISRTSSGKLRLVISDVSP